MFYALSNEVSRPFKEPKDYEARATESLKKCELHIEGLGYDRADERACQIVSVAKDFMIVFKHEDRVAVFRIFKFLPKRPYNAILHSNSLSTFMLHCSIPSR